jgi:hypothetical protein
MQLKTSSSSSSSCLALNRLSFGLLLAVTSFFGTSSSLVAADGAHRDRGLYGGFSIGKSEDKVFNMKENGFKFYGGMKFSRHLGIEAAIVDLGSFNVYGLKFSQGGLSLDLVGYLPLSKKICLFGKIGTFAWDIDAQIFGSSVATNNGDDRTTGFGGEFRLNNKTAIRFEWETYEDVAGGDVDTFTVGLNFMRF